MHQQSMATPSRRVMAGSEPLVTFYLRMPAGSFVGWLSIPQLAFRSENSFTACGLGTARPGERVLISPRSVREIDWVDGSILNVNRQKVKDGPVLESIMTVDRAYEEKHRSYY